MSFVGRNLDVVLDVHPGEIELDNKIVPPSDHIHGRYEARGLRLAQFSVQEIGQGLNLSAHICKLIEGTPSRHRHSATSLGNCPRGSGTPFPDARSLRSRSPRPERRRRACYDCDMADPISLEAKSTALVVIDLQVGILTPPTAPYSGDEVVQRAASLCQAAREAGSLVVLVRVTPSADGADALHPLSDLPALTPVSRPANWAEIVPEMHPELADFIITKRQWGAFYGTELDLQLRRRAIDTIVLCGVSANVGVESTARDAYERGYNLVLVEDATAARSVEEHAFVMRTVFPRIARVRKTSEVLAAFKEAGARWSDSPSSASAPWARAWPPGFWMPATK